MADIEAVLCEVQFSTTEIEMGIETIASALDKLKEMANTIGTMFDEIFNVDINTSTEGVAHNLDLVADKMTELVELMRPQKESWFDSILNGVDAFNILADGRVNFEDISKAIGSGLKKAAKNAEDFNIFKALIPDTLDAAEEMSKGVHEYIDAIKCAAPEVGTFSAMFPKLSASLSAAGTAISNGVGKFASSIGNGFGKISSLLNGTTLIWGAVIAVVIAGVIAIIYYWDEIKGALGTAAEWVNTKVIQPFVNIVTQGFNSFMAIAQNVISFVQNLFATFTGYLQNAFATDWTEQFGAFGHILNAFFANVQNIWEAVKQIFTGVVDFVKSIFAGDWKAAWDSVIEIFGGIWDGMLAYVKMPINGIIGLINLLIRGAVDGINAVIGLINNLQFDIPDWIPKIGGTTFGFNIAPITAPQIPYLAQGAVLPANRPFLAMVGDQKHGTNVEAPLATIQEALANVLAQQGMGGDIHITFTGDLAQLGRVLKPVIERENRRVGTSLVKGVM